MDEAKIVDLIMLGRQAIDSARDAFGKRLASNETAEAMCGHIEQWLAERGYAVNVRYEWVEDPIHGVMRRAGLSPVVAGPERSLRFTVVPREIELTENTHTVML